MEEMNLGELSQAKQVIMALLDNGQMAAKEIQKYLGIPYGSVSGVISVLKKRGAIEHTGYCRYSLTELGRKEAADIINEANPNAKEEKKLLVIPKKEVAVVAEKIEEEVKEIVEQTDKAQALRILEKVVDLISKVLEK